MNLSTVDFKEKFINIYSKCQTIFGLRFKTWNLKSEAKVIREDVIQNLMLLANGILAIVFAVEWNSDNNPLLIINNKFKSGINISSMDIFTTGKTKLASYSVTVPTNKGRGFYSKIIFSALHNGAFSQNFVYIYCKRLHKIH